MSAEMLTELKGLVDQINPTMLELRKEVDSLSAKQKDVVTEEKHNRMADSVTKLAEQLQAASQKQAALEAAFKRGDVASQDQVKADEAKAAMAQFLRDGLDTKGVDRGKFSMEIKAMSTDVNPDGGYIVRPEFVGKVVGRVFETSPMRAVADVINSSAKSIEMLVDDDEADAASVGEGASGGESDTPELGLRTITAHKYEATPKVTPELIADAAFDVEAWLAGKVSRKISRKENTDFILGNGAGKARGILTFSAWASAGVYEAGKIEQVNMGGASALTADGLIGLQNALIEDYQAGASWMMNRTTFGAALKLKGNDNYFFSPTLLRDGQAQMQLLGKNVAFAADMPVVAANALSIAYGDFRVGYTILDREGIIILRDPYSAHGFVSFYTTKRTGGDVTSWDAIKIGKVAA